MYIFYDTVARMKNVVTCVFCVLVSVMGTSSAYAEFNPFMGDAKNQIALMAGQGFDQGFIVPPPFRIVPFYATQIQYSQPTTFFRLPARQSLNIVQPIGMARKYGWDWKDFSIPIALASGDVALLYGCDWYTSVGGGVGLQAQQNDRIGTKLVFQMKLTAGYRFNENWGAEFYIQHFSNGNTYHKNYSYAFYGFGVTYSF